MKHVYTGTLIYILLFTLSPLLNANPNKAMPHQLLQFCIGTQPSGTFTFTNIPAHVNPLPPVKGELVYVMEGNILIYALIRDTFKDQSYSVITSFNNGGCVKLFQKHELMRFVPPRVLKDTAMMEQCLNK